MSIKSKYNILSFLYYFAGCCIGAFVTVFLHYKGLSDTIIGITMGVSCIISIFLTPFLTSLLTKIKWLDIKKMIFLVYAFLSVCYLALSYFSFSIAFITCIYVFFQALFLSSGSFLQILASQYIFSGVEINFGVARGMGSVAWALGAMLFGFLVDIYDAGVLTILFLFLTSLLIFVLFQMPFSTMTSDEKIGKSCSFIQTIKNHRIFFLLLIGFSFMIAAAATIGTYLINIVISLGGNNTFYGMAVFFMAISEMPVMAITPVLLKKFKTVSLIVVAGICYIVANFLICLSTNLSLLCIGMFLQGIAFGLLTAVITYYVIFNFEESEQTAGQTLIVVMTSGFGSMIGNLFGGFLQDYFGMNAMYLFVCLITIIGFVFIFMGAFWNKKNKYIELVKR